MAKFRGPCLDCGEYKNQQYTHKRCIACYQKFHRYSPEFQVREKYTGPCAECGGMESTTGRFIRKMCSRCYNRFQETGDPGLKEKNKYPGPCVGCGRKDPGYTKYFQEKMCGKCYRHYSYARDHPPISKSCMDCGKAIGVKSRNARCVKCHRKWMYETDPKYKARITAENNKYKKGEKGAETQRTRIRIRRARIAGAENTLTKEQWQSVLKVYGNKCVYCGSKKKIQMDHIIPVSKGGNHTINNVIPACRKCNNKKGNRQPIKSVQPLLL